MTPMRKRLLVTAAGIGVMRATSPIRGVDGSASEPRLASSAPRRHNRPMRKRLAYPLLILAAVLFVGGAVALWQHALCQVEDGPRVGLVDRLRQMFRVGPPSPPACVPCVPCGASSVKAAEVPPIDQESLPLRPDEGIAY